MIKKLLGLFLLLFTFINFSSAITYSISNVYKVGTYYESPLDSSIEFTVLKGGNVYSRKLGLTQNILTLMSYSQPNNIGRLYFWWNDGVPYFYYYKNSNTLRYGKFNKYAICDAIVNTGSQDMYNCIEDNLTDYSILGNFFSSIVNNDNWGFRWFNQYLTICFSSNSFGKSVCFYSNYYDYVSMEDNLDFNSFPTDIQGKAPGTSSNNGNSGIGDGGIPLGSDESALNYYESRYGWNENICYVGTDSLNYLYGQSGISFDEGNGLSIFDVYSQLYGSGYELVWVGNWLNTWLLNYEQWFNSRGINAEGVGHPSWLSYYNSGTHLGDLHFDDLTFPFANQPVAFYFMATYIDQNSPYSTMGSPVVSYCNIKINGGSFDDIIDESDKNNITDYTENHNEHLGLDSDGTERDYGAWLSSGVNLAFSGDVTVKNTLKNFFDQFYNFFNVDIQDTNLRKSPSSPILPGRLVSCLLFVILFKFIRKR